MVPVLLALILFVGTLTLFVGVLILLAVTDKLSTLVSLFGWLLWAPIALLCLAVAGFLVFMAV